MGWPLVQVRRSLALYQQALPLVAVLHLSLAGCSDSTGPGAFNAEGMTADVALVIDAFDQPLIRSYTASANAVRVLAQALGADAATLPPTSGVSAPNGYVGKTFEYYGHSFYLATDRPGAPTDGVRIILYAVDLGNVLVWPTTEIGFADIRASLTEENVFTAQVTLASEDATVLRYVATWPGTSPSHHTIAAEGHTVHKGRRINFRLMEQYGVDEPEEFMVDYLFQVPSLNLQLAWNTTHTEALSPYGRLDIDPRSDAEWGYTVKVNGTPLAIIGLEPPATLTFAGADGHTLTDEEQQAVAHVLSIQSSGYYFFHTNLISPLW